MTNLPYLTTIAPLKNTAITVLERCRFHLAIFAPLVQFNLAAKSQNSYITWSMRKRLYWKENPNWYGQIWNPNLMGRKSRHWLFFFSDGKREAWRRAGGGMWSTRSHLLKSQISATWPLTCFQCPNKLLWFLDPAIVSGSGTDGALPFLTGMH